MALTGVTRRFHSPIVQGSLLTLLVLLACGSTGVGVHDALHRSQDFQWSGERLLLQHIDPWAEYLRGDPQHRLLQTQIPNYLPILYLLIVPVGLLPLLYAKLLWALSNVFFAIASATMVAKFYGLRGWRVIALVSLMLMATPTRNSIGNGQQGLILLFLWCLSLMVERLQASNIMLVGVSYLKYSFAPPLALFLLFRKGVRSLLLSAVPALVATGLLWAWIGAASRPANPLRFVIEPFLVARTGFIPESFDVNLMNVVEYVLHGMPERLVTGIASAVAIVLCAAVSYLAFRRHAESSAQWQIAVMATMSYALFKHHPYDAIVLLFPMAYALPRWRGRNAQLVLALIGYLFFFERILDAVHLKPQWMQVPECLMLLAILAFTCSLREEPMESAATLPIRPGGVRTTAPAEARPLAA
jgi:hypothetical protein